MSETSLTKGSSKASDVMGTQCRQNICGYTTYKKIQTHNFNISVKINNNIESQLIYFIFKHVNNKQDFNARSI